MQNVELLTGEEIAEKLGYAYTYFRDRVSKKKGFPKKIGRKYDWLQVARFMQQAA